MKLIMIGRVDDGEGLGKKIDGAVIGGAPPELAKIGGLLYRNVVVLNVEEHEAMLDMLSCSPVITSHASEDPAAPVDPDQLEKKIQDFLTEMPQRIQDVFEGVVLHGDGSVEIRWRDQPLVDFIEGRDRKVAMTMHSHPVQDRALQVIVRQIVKGVIDAPGVVPSSRPASSRPPIDVQVLEGNYPVDKDGVATVKVKLPVRMLELDRTIEDEPEGSE